MFGFVPSNKRWTVEYYDILQNTVGGGKNKMFYHFRNVTGAFPMSGKNPAPTNTEDEQALVDDLQAHKTELYKDFIKEKAIPRPGVSFFLTIMAVLRF